MKTNSFQPLWLPARRKLLNIPKRLSWTARALGNRAEPALVCNSVPKSGTHLLLQVLSALPGRAYYGRFLASTPTVTLRPRTESQELRMLRHSLGDEILPAHLFHKARLAREFAQGRAIQVFIVRDPRDVILSEVHYLSGMNYWHRLSRRFRNLPTLSQQIRLAITGLDNSNFYYPDVGTRFSRYLGWGDSTGVLTVYFERLVDKSLRELEIERIGAFVLKDRDDVATFVEHALDAVDPKRSHTFRVGQPGGWRAAFNTGDLQLFQKVAGWLPAAMGYSPD